MKKTMSLILLALFSTPLFAGGHADVEAEVRAAVHAFNDAYANDDVETYFGHYADDAMVYFYGARQDIAAYHEEWSKLIAAGGGVEKNELSDIQIRVLAGGEIAVASYFTDYAMRTPDGEVAASKGFESEVWQKIDGEWKVVSLHYTEIAAGP